MIRIDGKDIRELDLHELRSAVGYLEQESFFFSGSIEDNLRYGKPEATPEELRVALRRSGLLEFETHLKMLVGERGVNMSSGQKQRLALARLLLRDPRLTILDEPTSNLDAHSELEIQRLLRTLQHRSTILLIAHRLSLVRIADSVAVLHKGRVVETGTHKELLAAGGAYSALWHAQMGADLKKEMSSR